MNEQQNWSQAWLDTQKQYFNAWMDWTRKGAASMQTDVPEFSFGKGVTEWWKSAAEGMPGENQELYGKAFEVGRQFFDMGGAFWKVVQDAQQAGSEWRAAFEQGMEDLKKNLETQAAQANDAWRGFASSWGLPGEQWQEFVKSLGDSPPGLEAMMGEQAGEAFKRILHAPALGYNREQQEKVQQWLLLAGEYQKAMQEYANLLSETNGKAVDLCTQRIVDLEQKGEGPETLRGVYDVWVDCGESAYGELAVDDRYLVAQGNLTNALMRLKGHENEMQQEWLEMMNIPGRRELDTVVCRLHSVRREVRDLKDQIEETEAGAVAGELNALRAEVQALRTELAQLKQAAPAPKPVAKKAVTRKKTAKKKAVAKPQQEG